MGRPRVDPIFRNLPEVGDYFNMYKLCSLDRDFPRRERKGGSTRGNDGRIAARCAGKPFEPSLRRNIGYHRREIRSNGRPGSFFAPPGRFAGQIQAVWKCMRPVSALAPRFAGVVAPLRRAGGVVEIPMPQHRGEYLRIMRTGASLSTVTDDMDIGAA